MQTQPEQDKQPEPKPVHDFRDLGNPDVKVDRFTAPIDLDRYGRTLREGT